MCNLKNKLVCHRKKKNFEYFLILHKYIHMILIICIDYFVLFTFMLPTERQQPRPKTERESCKNGNTGTWQVMRHTVSVVLNVLLVFAVPFMLRQLIVLKYFVCKRYIKACVGRMMMYERKSWIVEKIFKDWKCSSK